MTKNFLLIADNPGVGLDLRAQLNNTNEYYTLAESTFQKAPEYLNSQKYDKIFFSLPPSNKSREHYKKALVFVTALAKTNDVQAIDDFHSEGYSTEYLESKQIAHISRAELQKEPTSDILNALVSYDIEERRAARQRSDIKNAEIARLTAEITKLEYRLKNLEEWEEKVTILLWGGTLQPDGKNRCVLNATHDFWQMEEDWERVKELIPRVKLIEEKSTTNWQKQAVIWGVITAIISVSVPMIVNLKSSAEQSIHKYHAEETYPQLRSRRGTSNDFSNH